MSNELLTDVRCRGCGGNFVYESAAKQFGPYCCINCGHIMEENVTHTPSFPMELVGNGK